MSFTDQSGLFAVCLKIVGSTETLYYSNTAVHEPTVDWKKRLLNEPSTQRGYSLESNDIEQQAITVTLDNTDGEITNQLAADNIAGAAAYVYLSQADDDGVITHYLRVTGIVGLKGTKIIDEVRVTLKIEPTISSYFQGTLQHTITNDVFANAAGDAVGQGWPIPLNYCTATYGLIKLPMIDTTTNAQKLMFAQGTITAFGNLYRLRSGAWSTLTLTTHYTVTTGATDAKGRTYNYVTLASGVWADGDQYFANVQGMKVSGSLETNPATMLYTLITSSDYGWQVPTASVNSASFTAFETKCVSRGYVGTGKWGGVIPAEAGQVVDSQTLLRTMCHNMGAALAVNSDGEIVLVDGDYTQLQSSTDYDFTALRGDFLSTEITYPFAPIKSATVKYGKSHQDNPYANYFLAANSAVEDAFPTATEQAIDYPFVFDQDAAIALTKQHMLIRSGHFKKVSAEIAGYQGLQPDLGEIVGVTLPILDYGTEPHQLFSITDNLLSGKPQLEMVSTNDQFGSVNISLEETVPLTATLSTFIGVNDEDDEGGYSFTDAAYSGSYGSVGYLRHGHHYNYLGLYGEPPGTTYHQDINWRMFWRFELPSATWSTRTITGVSIQILISSIPSLQKGPSSYESGWTGSTIHECNHETWTGSSSWNSFDGAGTDYNPGVDQGTALGSFGGGTGTKTIEMNSTGLAMFTAAAGGTGQGTGSDEVNMCLANIADGNYTDAAVLSTVITALITYTETS